MVSIDLLGLCVLFSHFRPRDATRGNSFFQMPSYARANASKLLKKKQKASRVLKWENKMDKLKRSNASSSCFSQMKRDGF